MMNSNRLTGFVLRYHRLLGLLAALPVIFWGLSGLSHPIMTRLQPQPAQMTPPAELVSGFTQAELVRARPLSVLLPAAGVTVVQGARLLHLQGDIYYQLSLPGQAERVYLRAGDGTRLPQGDALLARKLAAHYAGRSEADIHAVQLVTSFSDEYTYVNRLLPVWRVDFAGDDHLRAYVDTSPLRLATLNDDGKALFSRIFRTLHSWTFIANEGLRDAVMVAVLGCAFSASLGGLWLYGFYFRKGSNTVRRQPLRSWHRRLGLLVALTTLTFTGSAMLHLLVLSKGSNHSQAVREQSPLAAGLLNIAPASLPLSLKQQVALVNVEGHPYFLLSEQRSAWTGKGSKTAMEEHHHHGAAAKVKGQGAGDIYLSAQDGSPLQGGAEVHAKALALQFSGLPASALTQVSRISKFGGEYGFINKRLPVYKVDFATTDHRSIFVETQSNTLAAEANDTGRLEGFSFAYLHKWNFLDFAGKNVRDTVAASFATLNALLAALGLVLYWRVRQRG